MSAAGSGALEWDFPTLAYLWDPGSAAITAGADRLEALGDGDRARCVMALSQRVSTLACRLDDGWFVSVTYFMIDDLYKSCFHQFRWSPGVHAYIAATAGVILQHLVQRGFVLHCIVDNTDSEANLAERITLLPLPFRAAGLLVTGPQLMALELMERADSRSRDVAAIPAYRIEGHVVADQLIERCHRERRSSVYLNLDLDDDTPGLSLDVALSQTGAPGTIVMVRTEPPSIGSHSYITPPPGVTLPR